MSVDKPQADTNDAPSRQEHEKFRAIFELSPDAIFLINLKTGKIIDANTAAAVLFETKVEKLIGRHFSQLHPQNVSIKAKETFTFSKQNPDVAAPPVEIQILTDTGKEKIVEISGRLLQIDGEECVVGIFRDITERQKTALQLKNLLTDVELAQKIAKIGHWQFDPEVGVPVWSEEVYRIYERAPSIAPPSISDYKTIYNEEHFAVFHSALTRAIEDGEPYDICLNLKLKDNEKWVRAICQPEKKKNGMGFILRGTIQDITAQRNAERQYELILKTSLDGFFIVNMEGYLIDVNDAYCKMTGYSRKELLTMKLTDLELIENEVENQKHIAQVFREGSDSFETKHKAKTGKILDIHVNVNYINIDGGKIVSFLRDITDIKASNKRLAESENKYKTLMKNLNAGVIVHKPDTSIELVNNRACQLLGLSEDQLRGKEATDHYWKFLRDDGSTMPLEEYPVNIIINKKEELNNYIVGVTRSELGDVAWALVNGYPEMNSYGNINYAVVSFIDITEMKKAEKANRKSEEKFAKYFNSNPSATFVWKVEENDFILVEVNDTALKMTKDKANSFLGEKATNVYKYNPELINKFYQCLRSESTIDFEFYYKNRVTGTREWLKFRFIYVEPGLIITYSDNISEQKKAEEELKQSEARFKQLVETASDAIYLMDGEGTIIDVNYTAALMLSKERAEILGHPIDTVDPNFKVEEFVAFWEQTPFETQQIFETTHVTKSGELLPVELSGKKFKIDNQIYYFGIARDITERKKAEEALRKSEEKFRLLAENIPGVIYLCLNDKLWSVLYINEQVEKLTGYPHLHFLNNKISFADLYHPDDKDDVYTKVENALAAHKSFHLIYRIKHKCGKWIWVEEVGSGIYENNEVISIEGTLSDITDRINAEKALIESEARFKALHNASFGGITIHDKGLILECNKGLSEITGYSYDELIGMNGLLLISDDTRDKVISNINRGYEKPYEAIGVRKDGSRYPVRLEARVIPYKGKQVRVVEFRDITESKKAEDALKISEERFALATESAKIGVWDLDLVENKLSWDDRMFELYGVDKSNFDSVYETWQKGVHPDDAERASNEVQKAINGEKDFDTEFRVVLPNGEIRYLKAYAQVIRDESGSPIRMTGVNLDITKEKESEEIMARSSKLESLGTLAGGIAHDFNNLLSGIYGNIELAKLKSRDENISTFLNRSIDSIERAQNLTSQLLTFSKGGEPVKKVEKLNAFLRKITDFSLSGSNVKCTYNIDENLMSCEVDKNQIGQVIDNLVINSVQAMPDGGMIYLSARNLVINNNYPTTLPNGNYISISVKDEGSGIPEALLSRIFDPFFTTKTTGHGIGLSTAYSIIKKHNGDIEVSSEVGKGTLFNIYLPAVNEQVNEKTGGGVKHHQGTGLFIILDDDKSIRVILKEILSEFGYTVVCFNSGEEVLSLVNSETKAGNKIAGMMFDLTIPGGTGGKEIISGVKEIAKETPVFVFSGYSDNPIMANPKKYGFTGSLVKPFKMTDLVNLLNAHMNP